MDDPYAVAQQGMALLKASVRQIVVQGGDEGLRNADIGRKLGIYMGHAGHEGHISRTILQILKDEDVIRQNGDKRWILKKHPE